MKIALPERHGRQYPGGEDEKDIVYSVGGGICPLFCIPCKCYLWRP